MKQHDDVLDAIGSGWPIFDTPVWYVVKNEELVGIIQQAEADTFSYRREAKDYPDCHVWNKNMIGWCFMETNHIRSAIWRPAKAPDVVLMANLLRD